MVSASFVVDTTEIATQIAEAAGGIASIASAMRIVRLSERYRDLYRQQREFYYNTFQQGVEARLSQDVFAQPVYSLNYAGRIANAYNPLSGPFGGAVTDAQGWWARHSAAYGAPPDPRNTNMEGDLARIKSDWANYFFRMEEHVFDANNDIRFRKRMMLHNIGIKQGSSISGMLSDSLTQFQRNIADMGDQMATYGNGIARYAGYKKGLSDTEDRFNRAAYERPVNERTQVPDFNYTMPGQLS